MRSEATQPTAECSQEPVRVLIVDDDDVLARALQRVLALQGFAVDTVLDGRSALSRLAKDDYDVMLLDLRMKGMDGMEVYSLSRDGLPPATIIHSAHIDVQTAVKATRAGVHDVMQKPVPEEVLASRIRELASQRRSARGRPRAISGGPSAAQPLLPLVGSSAQNAELCQQIRRVAHFRDVSVMIQGPTGTGKELVAQGIHALTCPDEPFVSINCAAVPEQLFESELFGHEAGAFTSAKGSRVGLLEEAGCGTLFLDEVGEMPLGLQAKLLRVLEIRQFRRVGGTRTRVLGASRERDESTAQFDAQRQHARGSVLSAFWLRDSHARAVRAHLGYPRVGRALFGSIWREARGRRAAAERRGAFRPFGTLLAGQRARAAGRGRKRQHRRARRDHPAGRRGARAARARVRLPLGRRSCGRSPCAAGARGAELSNHRALDLAAQLAA